MCVKIARCQNTSTCISQHSLPLTLRWRAQLAHGSKILEMHVCVVTVTDTQTGMFPARPTADIAHCGICHENVIGDFALCQEIDPLLNCLFAKPRNIASEELRPTGVLRNPDMPSGKELERLQDSSVFALVALLVHCLLKGTTAPLHTV